MINFEQWEGFEGRIWKEEVNVRDFIQKNYTPYDGDESFLAGPTEATDKLWGALQKLQKEERAKGGVLDMETEVVSSLTAYGPGYIDETLKDLEQIVGLQTDKPLKRAFMPYGGIKMAEQACTTYGYQPSEELHKIFTDYTRTHNQAVFDAYTPEMKAARHTHIITGLPDTYGRGRIVGDYRRVALYGIDALIKFKQEDFANCGDGTMTDDVIRLREEIARQIKAGKTRVGIDCYAGAEIGALARQLEEFVENVRLIDATTLAMDEKELDEKLAPYLPTDRDRDPVLLYGRRFMEGYEGLQNAEKVRALKEKLDKADGPVVVCGMGALCKALRDSYDLKVWMDLSPRQTAINYKTGLAINYGSTHSRPFSQLMRRNYYVDFETALDLRWELIREKALDGYIFADDPQKMQWLPYGALLDLFDELNRSPMRCRPVYLEGVWGGFYVHKLRKLPKEMKNCAWVFDMIPMEVSLAATFDGNEFEVPFYTFVQAMGEKLLGKRAYDAFGGYFPIRFNYDDTYHANGNMSIQCHPDAEYVIKNHSELGRQDESYYVCVTAQDAKTYLGFQNEDSCEKFFAAAEKAQETHELIDYTQYINAVPSVPGTQVMIPAGTVHASGRNQVILEIGSLTVGSYTYKLYDYQRIDPQTGLPRPIHLKMGRDVIHPERTAEFVRDNLVNHGGVVRQGEDWCEKVVGEHDLLYFSLRNLVFTTSMEDDTKDDFHVLALVDGEKVRVESVEDPSRYFDLNMLDIVVVPATFGKYRVVNKGIGVAVIHKTMLKP